MTTAPPLHLHALPRPAPPPPLGRLPEDVTRAGRRRHTAALLDEARACACADTRRRILVHVAVLNLPIADIIAERQHARFPETDLDGVLDVARLAFLQAVATFVPAPGADLWAEVIPVVRRAARKHLAAHQPATRRRDPEASRTPAASPLVPTDAAEKDSARLVARVVDLLAWERQHPHLPTRHPGRGPEGRAWPGLPSAPARR